MEEQQESDLEQTLVETVKDPSILVTEEIKTQRLTLCDACDKNNSGLCVEGPSIIKAKIWMKIASCPIGKWNAVDGVDQ